MKKRVLFINKSFAAGGIQTALNSMLSSIKDEFRIDVLIFYPEGPMKNRFPEGVTLITPGQLLMTFGMSFREVMEKGTLTQKAFRLFAAAWTRLFDNRVPIQIALLFERCLVGYDIAIAYHHEPNPSLINAGFVRYLISKVKAEKKLGWIHSDYMATGNHSKTIYRNYSELDRIIAVSETAKDRFLQCFPGLKEKVDFCYNYINFSQIYKSSIAETNVYPERDNCVVLLTACRLTAEKGICRAIEAFSRLGSESQNIRWYIAGEGPEKQRIIDLIWRNGLEYTIRLIGHLSNPYPYMREADWYFMTSEHETFGISALEARILGTSVLATDIPVMKELLTAEEDGIFCECSVEGMEAALRILLQSGRSVKEDHFPYRKEKLEEHNFNRIADSLFL